MNHGADDLLAYYKRELDYVRHAGREFARMHPQAAGRLELGGMESPDPHVERLIEAFAFLTGRVRRDLDNEFPQIAGAMLEALQPNFMAPVPAMTVVQFALAPALAKETAGRVVERETPLHAMGRRERAASDGGLAEVPCQFRTCAPLTLWPLQVSEASMEDATHHRLPSGAADGRDQLASVLRLRLRCEDGVVLGKGDGAIAPDSLRFHLHGDWGQVNPLYQLLLCNVRGMALVPPDGVLGARTTAAGASWREAGFAPDEAALPAPANAHPAYRLLQEYFAFPRKFMFFDAAGLAPYWNSVGGGREADLLLLLDRHPPPGLEVHPTQFLLGCVPAINLYPRTTETVRVDQQRLEYRLNPDMRRETTTEIHTIVSVQASVAEGQAGVPLTPYLADGMPGKDGGQYVARRDYTVSRHMGGTDIFLSFVGLEGLAGFPATPLVSAQTLCTNRALADSIRPDTPNQNDGSGSFKAIASVGVVPVNCLYQPTRQITPPLGGDRLWRLVSLLTLNQLSLENGELGRRALQQLIGLCNAGDSVGGTRQIGAIRRFDCNSVVRPVRSGPAPGFRRGVEVLLEFDDGEYGDGSPLLLAAVLQRFFPLYVGVNSFASVTVVRGKDEVKAWPPQI
jgi:type VI secretion system protein ImpG